MSIIAAELQACGVRLMDSSLSFDVATLDRVIAVAFNPNDPQRTFANQILMALQEKDDAWIQAGAILERSIDNNTRYFGLQILENAIKYRWNILPADQREGIKNFLVQKIISLSTDETVYAQNKDLLRKMDLVLVQILKQVWPRSWPTFISDIVASSKTSLTLCENNMQILKLLSEEIFDFSKESLTQAKIKELKESLNSEFALIFQLCDFITDNASKPSLITVTLQTLLRFLSWIPLGYVFETGLISKLTSRYLPVPAFRNDALRCLTEIGSLGGPAGELASGAISGMSTLPPQYSPVVDRMFDDCIRQLSLIVPAGVDIAVEYDRGSPEGQAFVRQLSLFFSCFFKAHLKQLERPEMQAQVQCGLTFLVRISMVDDDEIFKICLDYWNVIASDLYNADTLVRGTVTQPSILNLGAAPVQYRRKMYYADILHQVRKVMISRMAKPEEVLIVEDEHGHIVREVYRDTDSITLYKAMRETLVYITHLDYEDTETIMLEKLALQVDGSEWSWHNLNTLCWAIGSISGAMSEEDEKKFLVTVIKDLLGMCELKRGKDNKAVIASNIMYVVGQYPRFLRAHWKFLKTVVNKLFEFMHELHPGVQDMACDTFLKIAQKCRRKFTVVQQDERATFVEELIADLSSHVRDLAQPHQVHTFYEAVGCMLQVFPVRGQCDALLAQLMNIPNTSWRTIMQAAGVNTDSLMLPDTVKEVWKILKTNVNVCGSVGPGFLSQMSCIYLDMLNVYKWYSQKISDAVIVGGVNATKTSLIRAMRSVKKETLCLIREFVTQFPDATTIARSFIPPLLDPVLGDYLRSIPDARDPEVLSLFATVVQQLKVVAEPEVPRILEATFECTLAMITKNFEDYPEHRINFFMLLKAIVTHAFGAMFIIPPAHQKLIVDSVIWAFRHTERNISDMGLEILHLLLMNVGRTPSAQGFYRSFLVSLLQEILVVLTDRLHKSGFKMHSTLLKHIFSLVENNQVTVPLFDPATLDPAVAMGMTNRSFLHEHVTNVLVQSFPKAMTRVQFHAFVDRFFDPRIDVNAFKHHLRDFLIQLKEFSAEDNSDLFLEETSAMQAQRAAVPGMVNPNEIPYDDMADL